MSTNTAPQPTTWLVKAPCKAEPDAMFPGSHPADIEYAKSVCRGCSAVDKCLQWALDTGEQHGVWGGYSEAERSQLRHRAVRPINLDDYAGTRPTRSQSTSRTLQQAWEDGIEQDGDHLVWVGPKTVHHTDGTVTPNRLAFFIGRGRWPDGRVGRMCSVHGCVRPEHLADQRERTQLAA